MERFEAKRWKLLHVVIQRNSMFQRGILVTKERKQNVVCNVFAYIVKQAKKGRVKSSPLIRTVKATGVSRATLIPFRREKRQLPEDD